MKKIIAILAILMLVPFTAFGLEALSEDVLDDVTGQAGVSINLDVHVDATINTAAWGDADGIGGTSQGAYVGMQDMVIDDLRVRARDDWALGMGAPAFAAGRLTAGTLADLKFLTIDVAQDDTMYGGASFVRFGTGTLQISMTEFSATAGLAAGTAITDINEVLGTIYVGDMNVYLNDSRIDIYSGRGAGASGVTMDFDISVDLVAIETMSWGDIDGLQTPAYGVPGAAIPNYSGDAADTVAGYVGIKNFVMDNITVTGAVSIDVVTVAGAAGAPSAVALYAGWMAANPGQVSGTYVHMALNNIQFGMDEMSGIVALGATRDLDTANGQLGNFYVDGVSATVNGWVDIFAH